MQTDDLRRLAIRDLKKGGLLETGACGRVRWKLGGREVRDPLLIERHEDALRFERAGVTSWVPIEYVAAGFGGRQAMFACPNCQHRKRVLYGRGGLFQCRECWGRGTRCRTRTRPGEQSGKLRR